MWLRSSDELPIKNVITRIALLSLLNGLITGTTSPAWAQSNIGSNAIVSVKEDRSHSSVVLRTETARTLSRPIIQFLNGENGDTVMVADFPGVVFPYATRQFNVNTEKVALPGTIGSARTIGIKTVRVGRFQESPPITRIAIVSSDAQKLRSVQFDSRPGALTIKWSKSSHSESTIERTAIDPRVPIPAPGIARTMARRRAYQTSFQYTSPPFAPPTGEMDPNTSVQGPEMNSSPLAPEVASHYGGLRGPIAESAPPAQALQDLKPKPKGNRSVKSEIVPSTAKTASSKTVPAKTAPVKPASKTVSMETAKGSSETVPPLAKAVVKPAAVETAKATVPATKPVAKPKEATNKVPLETANSIPPVAPQRPGTRNIAVPQQEPTEVASNQSNEQKPGLIGSLFSKVKQKAEAFLSDDDDSSPDTAKSETTDDGSKPQISDGVKPQASNVGATPRVARVTSTTTTTATSTSADGASTTTSTVQTSAEKPNDGSPEVNLEPPAISLHATTNGGYALKVATSNKTELNFTSFRLHNPERFVIDFENMRGIQSATVPQPQVQELLQAIRVGAPDPLKNTGRLVLDLKGEEVSVIPGDTEGVHVVTLVIGETKDPLAGLNAPPGSTIVLDAGHGGTDPGAQRGWVKEKELTLAIAQKACEVLSSRGVKVVMTRDNDTFVSLPDRVTTTNGLKPDMFLSVHINSLESTSEIHGIETYYQTDMSKVLAQNIHESLVTELEAPDRNIRKAKFYVINRAEVPAVLAEVGFISNKTERDKLVSSDYQQKIAGALAKGAILYLKQHSSVAKKVSTEPTETGIRSGFDKDSDASGGHVSHASKLAQKGLGIKSH